VNRKLISLAAAFAVMIPSTLAYSQALSPTPAPSSTTERAASDRNVGPTVAASAVGIRAPSAAKTGANTTGAADSHMGAGQNVALMVVGGAAIIIGAIIGHTAGVLIAVAGAAIGLWGLYNFIQ
jgi:hypothetical protein